MTAETIIQSLASGLLMGLLYGLIAVGLALIFGLMDVVNFAHGEFLMIAMYATFFLFAFFAIDPLLAAPLVAAALFVFGARGLSPDRALCGAGQGQCRHGADLLDLWPRDRDARARAVLLHAGLSQHHAFLARRQNDLDRRHLPAANRSWWARWSRSWRSRRSISSFNRTDFGRALEATREDAGAVALVGIDKNRVFALGWGLGAALVGLAGAIMAMFFYVYPDVGASFALIAYVTVALGGFGSVFGAFAGGIIVGLVEAVTALVLPPSLKSVGIYAVYLLVVFIRPRGLFGSI